MSHERSITVQMGKRWINLPTKDKHPGHRTLSDEEAVRLFRSTGKSLGIHQDLRDALDAAENRSHSFDGATQPSGFKFRR